MEHRVLPPAASFSVTFTNGGEKHSADFSITPSTGRYMTGIGDTLYTDKARAETGIGVQVVSIYFFNTQNWDSMNAYTYLEGGTQLSGGWPGTPISYDGAFWYRADVKFIDLKDFTIIFNNNGTQTEEH